MKYAALRKNVQKIVFSGIIVFSKIGFILSNYICARLGTYLDIKEFVVLLRYSFYHKEDPSAKYLGYQDIIPSGNKVCLTNLCNNLVPALKKQLVIPKFQHLLIEKNFEQRTECYVSNLNFQMLLPKNFVELQY